MKKYLFILFAALTIVSCSKNPPCVNTKIVDIQVNKEHWLYSDADNNNYFVANIKMPEITWDVYDNAIINVYREYETGSNQASQTVLPYVRHKEYSYPLIDEDGKYIVDEYNEHIYGWGFYTETVDYEFTQGNLSIFYTASDFEYELDQTFVPEPMHFRVVIMYNVR